MIGKLSGNELQMLLAAVGIGGILLGALLGGIGFLGRRWLTGSAKQERVTYLASVAELASTLRTAGMTLDEIDDLEQVLRSPRIEASAGAQAIIAGEPSQPLPDRYATTFAMKERASATYEVVNAQLDQAIVDLRLLTATLNVEALDAAQRAWVAYRRTLMEAAADEYAGRSNAALAATLAGIAETERRLEEVRASVCARLDG